MTNEEYLKHGIQIMTHNSVYGSQDRITLLGDPLLDEPDSAGVNSVDFLNWLSSISEHRKIHKIAFNHEPRNPQ